MRVLLTNTMSKLRSPYPSNFENDDEEPEPSAGPVRAVVDASDISFWWRQTFAEAMELAASVADTIFVDIEVYENELKNVMQWKTNLSSSGKSIKIMYLPGDRYKGAIVDERLLEMMDFVAPLVSREEWKEDKPV